MQKRLDSCNIIVARLASTQIAMAARLLEGSLDQNRSDIISLGSSDPKRQSRTKTNEFLGKRWG